MAELIFMSVTAAGCETVAKVPMAAQKATAETLYEVDGAAMTQAAAIEAGGLICEWFALCENVAVTAEAHPILGSVPICERCKAKVDALA